MIVDKVVTTGPAFKVPSHLSFAQYAIDKLKDICKDKDYKDGVAVVSKTNLYSKKIDMYMRSSLLISLNSLHDGLVVMVHATVITRLLKLLFYKNKPIVVICRYLPTYLLKQQYTNSKVLSQFS